jgi:hypothetical protein
MSIVAWIRAHKKTSGALGVLIVLGFFLIVGIIAQKNEQAVNPLPGIPKKIASSDAKNTESLKDSDGDGLKDWEEIIYGTDPQNPDTDGDGTSDGEEIAGNRDPLKKGPKDILPMPEDTQGKPPTLLDDDPNNLTHKLFGDFIRSGGGANAILKNGGSEESIKLLTEKIDRMAAQGTLTYESKTAINPKDIRVTPDESGQAVTAYLNAVAAAFEQYLHPLPQDDLELFVEILQSGNLERLEELGVYAKAAGFAAAKIRALAVPKNLVWFHTREIEYLEETKNQIDIMRRTERDPLRTMTIINPRIDLKAKAIVLHYKDLTEWLKARNILLSPENKASRLIAPP